MTSSTSATVFLFDRALEVPKERQGLELDPGFLKALSAADPGGRTRSLVCRGDALLSELATKVTAVTGDGRRSGYTHSYDMELYRTLVWDFADALSGQWHSVDLETFPVRFANRSIHCISVPTLPADLKQPIDASLQETMAYLGAIEFDLGNPVQRAVFLELLIEDSVIAGGEVIMELDWDESQNSIFEGSESFSPRGARWVPYGELKALRPPVPDIELSARGEITQQRYEGKRRFSLQERVAAGLARGPRPAGASKFEILVTEDPSNPLEANLPEAKFIRYLLNPNHPKGGSKAKFFSDVLGIRQQDWRYLAAQFHEGLRSANLDDLGVKHFESGFGISFNATLPILGLNGATAQVETNWIFEPGQQPRLSTAFPAQRDQREGEAPPIVPSSIVGAERWAAIHELATAAGIHAAHKTVPTPMKVVGFGIEMEGACGFAWVRVPDARRGFARWALEQGHANRHYRSGAQIFAHVGSQSIDRAKAYATAFAAVLRHNGVECEVESRLD
ncbi:MAG: hypothetical protein K2X07_01505 [Caulobacteraceae bacterium]|nr:hypothetical protein [Caulobacteraceae bacterium]